MKILVVAATQFELAPLIKHIGLNSVQEGKIASCNYKGKEVNVLVTAVGMVATAYYLGKYLSSEYDVAINAGICGSFNHNLQIGSVVNIVEDSLSELGAEDGDSFLSLAELNLPGITKVINKSEIDNQSLTLIPKVNGVTVNTVHGNESTIDKVVLKFHPIVESMEGAAFMFACQAEEVPHIQLRAVSNYVERRNKESWNIPLAINNLNEKLIEILAAFK